MYVLDQKMIVEDWVTKANFEVIMQSANLRSTNSSIMIHKYIAG